MSKKEKLQQLLKTLTPPDERASGTYENFNKEINQSAQSMVQKVVSDAFDEVTKRFNDLKDSVKPPDYSELLDVLSSSEEEVTTKLDALEDKDSELEGKIKDSVKPLSDFEQRLEALSESIEEVNEIVSTLGESIKGVSEIKDQDITSVRGEIFNTELSLRKLVEELPQTDTSTIEGDITLLKDNFDKLQRTMLSAIPTGGGAANRQIRVEGADVLTKYTDINFYGVTSSVITSVDNINQRVNIGIQGSAGGGGSGTWGSITGTLSSQTDLQTALNAKQASITATDKQVIFSDGANNPVGNAGFTFDKATNKVTLTGGINLGNLTSGRIPFITTAGLLTDDSSFVWNSGTSGIGIGSATFVSTEKLHVNGSSYFDNPGIFLYHPGTTRYLNIFHDGTDSTFTTFGSGGVRFNISSGVFYCFNTANDCTFSLYGKSGGVNFISIVHNNTDATLSTGTGKIILSPSSTVDITSLISKYKNITTAGWGVPGIYGSGRSTAQTAAVASVATYTCGAADGSFLVSGNVLVTTSSAEAFNLQVAYTDESNTARTLTLPLSTLAGALVAQVNFANGAVPYAGDVVQIRVKASTAITIKTAGTFTGATYNVEGSITQIS